MAVFGQTPQLVALEWLRVNNLTKWYNYCVSSLYAIVPCSTFHSFPSPPPPPPPSLEDGNDLPLPKMMRMRSKLPRLMLIMRYFSYCKSKRSVLQQSQVDTAQAAVQFIVGNYF